MQTLTRVLLKVGWHQKYITDLSGYKLENYKFFNRGGNKMSFLYAQCGQSQTELQSTSLINWIPLIVIFLIFYFILILPEQKKIKQHKRMLDQLKKGDHVLLSSGIYGTIVDVKGDVIQVKIAENVKINVLKSAVSQIVSEEKMKSL